MKSTSALSVLATLPLLAHSTPLQPRQAAPTTTPFNDLIKAAGKTYFGTAEDLFATPGEANDTLYQTFLNTSSEFGQLTPANAMKFEFSEPEQGVFNFTPGQQTIDYAKANGQLVRCHNLVWHSQLPDWITGRNWTAADNATLTDIMKNHIQTLINHFGNDCYAWDVVNEPLTDPPANGSSVLQDSPFLDAIGPAYFPLAFQFASEAADNVTNVTGVPIKLYVNEYNDEYAGPKATALQDLVQGVQDMGIRIDGVGFESHFIVGETPDRATQAAIKQNFTDMGLDVAVTELDVRFSSLPPNDTDYQQQATDYVNSVGSCLDVPRCVGVTVWDFDDDYSWIPGTFTGEGDADLYNGTLAPKPAVASISSLLAAAATHAPTPY